MSVRISIPLVIATTALALLSACNSGGAKSPAAPAALPEAPSTASTPIPAAVRDADVAPGQGLLGLNQVTLDVANMTATLEPVRMASAIGDSFDVDIYEYLKKSPCTDCLEVSGLKYAPSGNVEVTFAARHPFAFGPARYDLHVFDVRGTLIPVNGTADGSGIMSQMGASSQEASGQFGVLANAEGYSSFFTEQVAPYIGPVGATATGTIFPYKTMFADLNPSTYIPAEGSFADLQFPGGHNVMAMGEGFAASATAFEIDVDGLGNQVQFLFLLDAAYGASATRPTRQDPKYFLPEFHRKEAFDATMEVTVPLPAGGGSGFSQAIVTARDWQGDQAADPAFGPEASADALKHQSSVSSIEFFVPGVMSGVPQVKTNGVDFTGVVQPGTYWTTYEATFTFQNTASAPIGTYWAVAAIRDSLYNTGDALAVTREFPEGQLPQVLTDLTTYVVGEVIVEATGPTFDIIRNPVPADPVHHGDLVQFVIDNIDPGAATVTAVEADPDWDGVPANFTPSVVCTMIDVDTYQTQYDWRDVAFLPTPATARQFAVRITDSNSNIRIESEPVTLTPNMAPTIAWQPGAPTTGSVGSAVTITAAHVNANDADGTVTTYRIGWGDATPDYVGTLPAAHTYASANTFTMSLFARDNGYGPAIAPSPQPAQAESTVATRNIVVTNSGLTAPWTEDFETTADGALPANWVKFTPASVGTTHEFGVRSGTTAPAPMAGQTKVLEESGWGQTAPGDRNYPNTNPGVLSGAAQAARWSVFTPEIAIPNDASTYTLEVTHWMDYNWVTLSGCGGNFGGDGCNMGIKVGAAGTVTATEAGLTCLRASQGYTWTTNPQLYDVNAASGAGNMSAGLPAGFAGTGIPGYFWGRGPGNSCPNSGAYYTSTLVLPNALKGQSIRLYFMHGQQQVFSAWNGGGFWGSATPKPGWRIDQVRITQS